MSLREEVIDIPGDICCPVTALLLFPIGSRTRLLSPRPGTAMFTCHGPQTTS